MGVAVGPRFRTRFLIALHYIKRAQTIAQSLTRATVLLSTFNSNKRIIRKSFTDLIKSLHQIFLIV
jgi:hypothetical protein